jgi:hypothetical protein
MRRRFALILLALIGAGITAGSGRAQQAPIRLFNGKSLAGWYTFLQDEGKGKDALGVFKVEDGMLHVSGQKFGYVSTEKDYENYRLTVEFKWGTKKWPPRETAVRDAGLLYHVGGPDQVWANCIECQIQEQDTGDVWLIPGSADTPSVEVLGRSYGGGKDYTRVVKWADYEKPHGEWNTVTLIVRGDRFEHWVNGRCNMRGRKANRTRGKIQLQSEGAELFYRNVVLEPL